jgi:hypothetical protein
MDLREGREIGALGWERSGWIPRAWRVERVSRFEEEGRGLERAWDRATCGWFRKVQSFLGSFFKKPIRRWDFGECPLDEGCGGCGADFGGDRDAVS